MDLNGLRAAIAPLGDADGEHSPVKPRGMFVGLDSEGEDSDDVAADALHGLPPQGRGEDSDEDGLDEGEVEAEDSDDELERDVEALRPILQEFDASDSQATPAGQDDKAARAGVSLRGLAVNSLHQETERVVENVQERVGVLLDTTLIWLKPLWDQVASLPATCALMETSWNELLGLLAVGKAKEVSTKTASSFTLGRFDTWPKRLTTWFNDPCIQEGIYESQLERGKHYLCCIANFVDEELYNVFVEERANHNMITLAYPTKVHHISPPRGCVLYYISGYVLSRTWTHLRRRNLSNPEWETIVTSNHSKCRAVAIERDPPLVDLVGVVDQRNDPKNGAGLLYPTLAWFEFIFAVENGYYHFLSQPLYLGAFLGDLPTEILKVVSASTVVREKWAKCCPLESDTKVTDEVFAFVVGKFHNVRMGDFARSMSANTSLRQSKGELALRQQLKAGTAKESAGNAGKGAGCGEAQGGGKAKGVLTLAMAKQMSDEELFRLTKDELCELINSLGVEDVEQGDDITKSHREKDLKKGEAKPWRTKAVLVPWLKLKVLGLDREVAETQGVDEAGLGLAGTGEEGADAGATDVATGSPSCVDVGGNEWVDVLPFKDADIGQVLADVDVQDEANTISHEDFPYDFCSRPIFMEEAALQADDSFSSGAAGLGVIGEGDELFDDVFFSDLGERG